MYQLVNYLYCEYRTKVFSKLRNIHFCFVIFDKNRNKIIAGRTEASSKYTNLFYGYTRQNHELMFSNLKEVLMTFCDEVKEMDNNTYMWMANFIL